MKRAGRRAQCPAGRCHAAARNARRAAWPMAPARVLADGSDAPRTDRFPPQAPRRRRRARIVTAKRCRRGRLVPADTAVSLNAGRRISQRGNPGHLRRADLAPLILAGQGPLPRPAGNALPCAHGTMKRIMPWARETSAPDPPVLHARASFRPSLRWPRRVRLDPLLPFTCAVLVLLGAIAQINPVWLIGPYQPGSMTSGAVGRGSQRPDRLPPADPALHGHLDLPGACTGRAGAGVRNHPGHLPRAGRPATRRGTARPGNRADRAEPARRLHRDPRASPPGGAA